MGSNGFLRFIAFLVLLGLLALGGAAIYNAGVSAGVATDVGNAIASGAQVPAGYYYGPYVGHPWGFGFGFGGFFIGILFFFLFIGLIRAVFGWGRWGHRGYYDRGRRSGWHDHLDAWHDEQHGKAPDAPGSDQS